MKHAIVTLAICLIALAGCGEDPVSPPKDPFVDMYGSYYGTFNFQFGDGTLTQDPMFLKLGEDKECLFQLSGANYSARITSWDSDSVAMIVNFASMAMAVNGTRRGITISGTSAMPGVGSGTWSVTK